MTEGDVGERVMCGLEASKKVMCGLGVGKKMMCGMVVSVLGGGMWHLSTELLLQEGCGWRLT